MAPLPIPQAMHRYERQVRDIERLARNSVSGRMSIIRRFVGSLPPEVEWTDQLHETHVAAFFSEVGPQWSDGTYNLYAGRIRRWLEYLAREGMLGADPAPWRNLKPRRLPKAARPKHFLYREEVIEIAEAAAEWHVRDKYLILLSHAFRRRVSEMVDMKVGDIDLTARPDMPYGVFGYRNIKSRKAVPALPILAEDRPWVDEWLAEYERLLGRPPRPHEPLFPALKPGPGRVMRGVRRPMVVNVGKPMPAVSANDLYKRAQTLAGNYVKYRSSHAVRRGGLVDLLPHVNNDIRLVKTYAGHESERTTEVYMDEHKDVRDLAKALLGGSKGEPAPAQPEPTRREDPAEGDSVVVNFADIRRRRKSAG